MDGPCRPVRKQGLIISARTSLHFIDVRVTPRLTHLNESEVGTKRNDSEHGLMYNVTVMIA